MFEMLFITQCEEKSMIKGGIIESMVTKLPSFSRSREIYRVSLHLNNYCRKFQGAEESSQGES